MPYAGDVTPAEAYEAVSSTDAILVDVRSAAEWAFVGTPDLTGIGREAHFIEWSHYGGAPNEDFIGEIGRLAGPGRAVYFICRSGARSAAAAEAATGAGIGPAYNVIDGFEGPLDEAGHRAVGGWKNVGLPWRQS